MKKIITTLTLLFLFTISSNAISFAQLKAAAKLVSYSKSKEIWVNQKKMLSTLAERNKEIKSFNAWKKSKDKNFKPKKLYTKKVWIKAVYATAMMFRRHPTRVIWYTSKGPKGQLRLIGFSKKTGMVIIFNNQLKIVTTYTSNTRKLSARAKKGSITFMRKADAKKMIRDIESAIAFNKLTMSQGLVVNWGLFF